ncbi:MAG TPA: hypothetical protein VF027_09205 [Sphingomicrobium sp.]
MAKLSISRAWDETKAILARDGRLVVAVALALFVLPGVVLNVTTPQAPAGELPRAGPWIAVAIVALVASVTGQLAVIRLAMGPHVSVAEAIRHGALRALPYLGAMLIWAAPVILIGGFLAGLISLNPERPPPAAALGLLVLMGVAMFLAVRFMMSSPVASAEHAGPVTILSRSWKLTAGNWWRLFGFLLLFGIGALALLFAVAAVVGVIAKVLLGGIGPMTLGGLLVAIVGQLLNAAMWVVFFVMLARLYLQLAGRDSVSVPSSGT